MAEESGQPAPGSSGGRVTRRQLLTGATAAGVGGLVVGGVGGYLAGNASASNESQTPTASGSKKPITIGSASMITGAYAGDGQQCVRGQKLAIQEINDKGGLLGRELKLVVLDTKEQQPDVMKTTYQNLVSQNVAAILSPFTSYTSVEYPIVAEAGIPTFHVNTWHGNVDYVKANGIKNIFQCDLSETSYGPGFVFLVNDLQKSGAWTPSSKTIAVVTSNDPYSLNIAKTFRSGMEAQGWTTTMFQEFTAPQADWGSLLVKIRQNPPGDEASFIKQFRESPTQSLVYEQYAPSIPQYLDLAGDAANGVLWATVVGLLSGDARAKAFSDKFQAAYGSPPGFSNAGDQYDIVHLWAQNAAMAGDPYDFDTVNSLVTNSVYRGVCGAYSFLPGTLTCYPYPDDTPDPSLGMPHLTFQIQDGQQVLISPEPYTTGKFQLPEWLNT